MYLCPINLFQRRQHQKLVDEIELKRRSNSQQDRLADYKMRQNLNRLKNSGKHLPIKAKFLLLKLIHLFAREVL